LIKLFLYLPVHLLNTVLAYSPRSVFIAGYQPSSDAIRDSELAVKNTTRLIKYFLTK